MEEEKPNQTIRKEGILERIMLPDGKTQLPCVPGLLYGKSETIIEDKGESYLQKNIVTMKFAPNYFLRFCTSIRQVRDNLRAYKYFDEIWKKYEPFVKEAAAMNKVLEKKMERSSKKTNPKMR